MKKKSSSKKSKGKGGKSKRSRKLNARIWIDPNSVNGRRMLK